MDYKEKTKTEMGSIKNAISKQNIQNMHSLTDLCEINGIKTIRELIKEGVWLLYSEFISVFNYTDFVIFVNKEKLYLTYFHSFELIDYMCYFVIYTMTNIEKWMRKDWDRV